MVRTPCPGPSICRWSIFGLILVLSLPAQAEPGFTALYGQDCTLCHVNPTGGGMRTLYASQYLVPEEISMEWAKGEDFPSLNPEITPGLTVGADLRTLLYLREGGQSSIFSMQGDLYVYAQVGRRVGIYWEQGQGRAGEVFGAAQILPLNGYLKVGRFIPDYGWRFADHQMFTRRYLFDSEGLDDPGVFYGSGIEAGASQGIVTISASVQEVSRGDPDPQLGDNYAYRLLLQKELGGLRMGVGGSVIRRKTPDGHVRASGGFWYLGLGPVNWLGQVDETSQDDVLGNLVAQELTVWVARGIEIRATYNFQDPDRDQSNGARHRGGVGAMVMPTPFFSVQLMGNYWWLDQGPAVGGEDYAELELVAHFFF